MFSIGEFARLSQVSVKMLRHYDSIGLLRPARVDPVTGYRYYAAAQLPDVGRIRALRDLGFGLTQIAALTASDRGPAAGDVAAAYQARERQIRASISAGRAQLTKLAATRAALPDGGHVQIRSAPRLHLATAADRDFAALELQVAAHGARADGPPMTLIGREVLIAVPVRHGVVPGVATRALAPADQLACSVHTGAYQGLPAAWQALLSWVRHAGVEPDGDLREVYLSFSAEPGLRLRAGYLADTPAGYVTELQVPLTRCPGDE